MRLNTLKKSVLNIFNRQLPHVTTLQAYTWPDDQETPREKALEVSREIRGSERLPAIMLHGVMRRSGTNFVGDLINLHPDLCGYPGDIFETPFLASGHLLSEAQEVFLNGYQRNREKIGGSDFLPLFGAAFIAYLHSMVPNDKQMLVKVPGVEQIWQFSKVFPYERLVILQRDGRDLVASTMKSWPDNDFETICARWDKSQQLILELQDRPEGERVCFVRFEDAVANPKSFVKDLLGYLGGSEERYPYDLVDKLPVKGSSSIKVDGKMTWKAVEKPKSFNPVGRWAAWTDQQKAIFKRVCGKTLIRSGYSDNLDW